MSSSPADLVINAVADEQVVPIGESVLYTLTVTNTSSDTAVNVTVSASLPLSPTILLDTATSDRGAFVSNTARDADGLRRGDTSPASPTKNHR